jgi:hypothetical protein
MYDGIKKVIDMGRLGLTHLVDGFDLHFDNFWIHPGKRAGTA